MDRVVVGYGGGVRPLFWHMRQVATSHNSQRHTCRCLFVQAALHAQGVQLTDFHGYSVIAGMCTYDDDVNMAVGCDGSVYCGGCNAVYTQDNTSFIHQSVHHPYIIHTLAPRRLCGCHAAACGQWALCCWYVLLLVLPLHLPLNCCSRVLVYAAHVFWCVLPTTNTLHTYTLHTNSTPLHTPR